MPYEKIDIAGKTVFVVEAHHHVLGPWADIRKSQDTAAALLTLDYHTDTYEPFLRYRHEATGAATFCMDHEAMDALLPGLIASIDHNDADSVEVAVSKLANDEHIHTAIQARMLSRAFVITLSESDSFADPDEGVYVAGSICAIGCVATSHTDACTAKHAEQVLETIYLDHALNDLDSLAQGDDLPAVEDGPYILDIDLDFFRSEKAIAPDDTKTFYRLVRNAIAVTIATEPEYVEECRLTGSTVTSDLLLERMRRHIEAAMT